MILHKGVTASGMCITIKALYKLGQMITSFLHEVFVEIIESETPTTTAVKVLPEMMTTTRHCQF